MIALPQLLVVGFVVLSFVYIGLSLYSRRVRRGKLRRKWENSPPLVDQNAFVPRGLKKYDGSIRRKLILGVYVISVGLVALIVYLTNFN